jgi:phosphoserine phosphatase
MTSIRDLDDLSLWNESASKRAIVSFVNRVTTPGTPEFVPQPARVAVFDNDGTLWCEKPMPIELDFILRRLEEMGREDPTLRFTQPWKAAYSHDHAWLAGALVKHYQGDDSDVKMLIAGMLQAFRGMNVETYTAQASEFLRGHANPELNLPYLETAYAPMLDLLRYLERHGFTNYIASGGDRDFMRPVSYELYGIPEERIIGSANALRYEADSTGSRVVYRAQPDVLDDGPMKPVRIWSRIGRRPIFAAGNSNGDIPMLEFVEHAARPSLSIVVNHDDDARDVCYTAGAETLMVTAFRKGWTVVSVAEDWRHVFNDKAIESTERRAA